MVRSVSLKAATFAMPLVLASLLSACGSDKDNSLASLDAKLTNNATDPALKGALEDQIVVDPNLTNQANINAVRPADRPPTGGVPLLKGAAATAEALNLAGGKLLHAPAAVEAKPGTHRPLTLGALARDQNTLQGKQGSGNCTAKMDYGMQWAQRLPDSFPLYPGASLMDAAGADGGNCSVRAVSFVAGAPMQDVIDFYYTLVKRTGYDAEHQILNGDHVLGGGRASDDGAYIIMFANAPNGGTAVDIVANNGQ